LIVQTPPEIRVTVVPETVHTPVVALLNCTVSPESDVPDTATVPSAIGVSAGGVNVIVCGVFVTSNESLLCGAAS
jgi:hypothetical protein